MKSSHLSHRMNVIFEPLCLPFPVVTWFVHTKSSILNSPGRGVWMLSCKPIRVSTCWIQNAGGSVWCNTSCDVDDAAMGISDCMAVETLNPKPRKPLTQQRSLGCVKPHWCMCIQYEWGDAATMNAVDKIELMKMKAHMWDLSIFAYSPSLNSNVYCMWGKMLQQAMQCHLVDNIKLIKMKAHMVDLSKFTHPPSLNPNVYCVWRQMLQQAMQSCHLVDNSELMKMKAQMWDLSNSKHTHHP